MTKVPITFAFDHNMFLPAKVCIFSLLENAMSTTSYDVYVLRKSGCISMPEEKEVEALFEGTRHRVAFVDVGDVFDECFQIRGITTATYYRIIIPHIIDQINAIFGTTYNQIIYQDVDTIAECDYSALMKSLECDKDFWIAGVAESPLYWISEMPEYLEESKVQPEEYVNAGFLVMNIANLVQNSFFEKCKEHFGKEYFFQDQDIINLVCNHHKHFISLKYNYTTLLYDRANVVKDSVFINSRKSELDDTLDSMIHYTGTKPWNEYVRRGNVWWYYYQKSPFYNSDVYIKHFFDIDKSLIQKSSGRPLLEALCRVIKKKIKNKLCLNASLT